MQYSQGSLGRVYAARLEESESIYEAVDEIAIREKIESGIVFAIGGMRKGKVVSGPKNKDGKIDPIVNEVKEPSELVGIGTLFRQEHKPSLHFHAAIGREDKAIVGCPRIEMSVYLILEVIIIEFVGIDAMRMFDEVTGVHLLDIFGPGKRELLESN
jgi:uncharacterized protein